MPRALPVAAFVRTWRDKRKRLAQSSTALRRRLQVVLASVLIFSPALKADTAPEAKPDPWQRAMGPWVWSFPRDHGAHPNFKTEWWYFTGNLKDDHEHRFGYQLTIFRQGVQFTPAQKNSKWAVRDFYFGHFTISDIGANQFHFAEKVSRGELGDAEASPTGMGLALSSWTINPIMELGKEKYLLKAQDGGIAIDLTAIPGKPLILEGVNGLSQKADGAGEASYYYSYPRLATSGDLNVDGKKYQVEGLSWFDHEFSTSSLGKKQVGWDWFCIQLENNEEIMLYAMRDKSGALDPNSEGTWVRADGTSERILPGGFTLEKKGTWKSPHSGAVYPAGWHILIPGHHADLTVTPAMVDQELNLSKMGALAYWEGACTIEGQVDGKPAKGVGYTELTGYSGAIGSGMTGLK